MTTTAIDTPQSVPAWLTPRKQAIVLLCFRAVMRHYKVKARQIIGTKDRTRMHEPRMMLALLLKTMLDDDVVLKQQAALLGRQIESLRTLQVGGARRMALDNDFHTLFHALRIEVTNKIENLEF